MKMLFFFFFMNSVAIVAVVTPLSRSWFTELLRRTCLLRLCWATAETLHFGPRGVGVLGQKPCRRLSVCAGSAWRTQRVQAGAGYPKQYVCMCSPMEYPEASQQVVAHSYWISRKGVIVGDSPNFGYISLFMRLEWSRRQFCSF